VLGEYEEAFVYSSSTGNHLSC